MKFLQSLQIMFLPMLSTLLGGLTALLKEVTPDYLDRIIDIAKTKIVDKLILIKLDNNKDDKAQMKAWFNENKREIVLETADAAIDGIQVEFLGEDGFVKDDDIRFVLNGLCDELQFLLQKIVSQNGEFSELQKEILFTKLETFKKK